MIAVDQINKEIQGARIEVMATKDVIPFKDNTMTHDDEQIDSLVESIKEFGFTAPLLIRADNVLIAGHARHMAAMRLKLPKVPVIRLAHLSEDQARALVIADNKLSRHRGARWDYDKLQTEINDLFTNKKVELKTFGMTPDEVSTWLAQLTPPKFEDGAGAGDDFVPEDDDSSDNKTKTKSSVIQFSLVFDNDLQKQKWHNFIKWLKSNYEGQTLSERLTKFIDEKVGV